MKSILLGLVFIMIFTLGCTQTTQYTCPDGSNVSNLDLCNKTEPSCMKNWQCENWSVCSPTGTQTRECIDLNNCGGTKNKLSEIQSCIYYKPKVVKNFTGDISKLALNKIDLPLEGTYWYEKNRTEVTESNGLARTYVSDMDKKDGWEIGYLVKYRYDNALAYPSFEDAKLFDMTQLILAFPLVDEKINSTYMSDEKNIKFLLVIDTFTNYNTLLKDSSIENLSSIDVGGNEFFYRINKTNDLALYGVVFTKGNILERISIYGMGTSQDIIKQLAIKAVNKIS